jgi:hypothetical protein
MLFIIKEKFHLINSLEKESVSSFIKRYTTNGINKSFSPHHDYTNTAGKTSLKEKTTLQITKIYFCFLLSRMISPNHLILIKPMEKVCIEK